MALHNFRSPFMGMQTKFSFSALKIDLSMFWNILVFFFRCLVKDFETRPHASEMLKHMFVCWVASKRETVSQCFFYYFCFCYLNCTYKKLSASNTS